MAISEKALCDRYESLYPGVIADNLDKLGYTDQVLPPSINPLTKGMRVAGIAYPVIGRKDESVEYDQNIRRILKMLSDAPEESVLVTKSQDDTAAHLGELSTTALDEQGCRGAIIDGGVRDVRFILEQDFPVFARYRTPADAPPRWRIENWNVPVEIGNVEIHPGDVLVGDVDGVVHVPRDIAQKVLEAAEETAVTESDVRQAVGNGVDPVEAYDRHGKF